MSKFVLLNASRINKVKDYFKTIHENLYSKLLEKNRYFLYQNLGKGKQVFLVSMEIHNLVSSLRKAAPIKHCGINLGFFQSKRDRKGYNERFYLSFEGGRFLYSLIQNKFPKIFQEIQIIKLNTDGERSFLYGQDISLDRITSETEDLVKRRLIFVLNRKNQYIGLALLKVKLIGNKDYSQKTRYIEEYSRSGNFMLSILNLADAGYYLRGEGKK